jgi:hypothetical protein
VSHGASKHVVGACECKRCRGLQGTADGIDFAPGNDLSISHGALASPARLANEPETVALAEGIRDSMPSYADSDEPKRKRKRTGTGP